MAGGFRPYGKGGDDHDKKQMDAHGNRTENECYQFP